MPAPSTTVRLAGQDRRVTFDFNRLVRVEEITGATVVANLVEFGSYAPGVELKEGVPPTPEQIAELQASAARFSVAKVGRFVSACTDVPQDDLPLPEINPAFFALLLAFTQAVRQINEGTPEDPSKAPSAA